MSGPTFASRDPTAPAFWDERFAAGFTPWDAAGCPPAFARWLAVLGAGAGRRVLVPGCGAAYEVAALDAAGFAVTAIDYAPQAVAAARAVLGEALSARTLQQADFFADAAWSAAPFDLIYERAFVAALPPSLWPRWAARCSALLRPGGAMSGLFVIDAAAAQGAEQTARRGPPFCTTAAELDALLGAQFARGALQPVPAAESLPVFAGREHWIDWQRLRPGARIVRPDEGAAAPL
jgi:protein-L-isoaspartate O-methyltransferase